MVAGGVSARHAIHFCPPQHSRWRDEGKGKGKDIYIADRKDRGQPTAMSFVNRGHGKGKGTGKGNANSLWQSHCSW